MKKKNSLVIIMLCAVLLIVFAASCERRATRKPVDSKYFPAHVGDKWVYSGYMSVGRRSIPVEFSREVTGIKDLNYRKCFKFTLSVRDPKGRFNHGKPLPLLDTYYEISDKGVFVHAMGGRDRTGKPKTKEPKLFRPEIKILNAPLITGDKWHEEVGSGVVDGKNKGKEYVKTKLGKFLSYRVDTEVKSEKGAITYKIWYGEEVGIVKEIIQVQGRKLYMVLKEYQLDGKKGRTAKEIEKERRKRKREARKKEKQGG